MIQTYGVCDPVIDGVIRHGNAMAFRLGVHEGSAASGRILQTPFTPARGDGIVLRLNDDSTLTVEWDDSPTDFCREWAWITERCGA